VRIRTILLFMRRVATKTSRKLAVATTCFLFAAGFAAPSEASVFTTSEFTVTTSPDVGLAAIGPGPILTVIEGSGPCGANGCDSLDLSFTVKNTTASTIQILFAGGAPSFVSGDPLDSFVTARFTNDCGAGLSLDAGASCTGVVHYFTAAADFDGNSGLNRSGFEVEDKNDRNINVNMSYQMTIVDPEPAPLPSALPLFVTVLGAFGLFGRRSRRKASLLGQGR